MLTTDKDREEEARATLIRIRRVPETDDRIRLELLEIKAAAIFDHETTRAMYPNITSPIRLTFEKYKSLFVVRHLNRRLLIACLLQVIQQFTGMSHILGHAVLDVDQTQASTQSFTMRPRSSRKLV